MYVLLLLLLYGTIIISVSSVSFLVDPGHKISERSTGFIPVDQCVDSEV